MPNRIIKDSIHTSDTCNAMTDFQFRLWISLITYVDDYGRGDARPAIIKGSCFPLRDRLTNKDIESALTGLAGLGCISLYEVDGKSYLCFPTWEKHQSIRNQKSRFPAPPDNLQASTSNCNQEQANVPVIQSNPNPNPNPNPKERTGASARTFTPPTVADVREYCESRKNSVDAERFVDFYASKGWKVGNQPMRDWRAAVRTWEKREEGGSKRGLSESSAAGNRGGNRDAAWGISGRKLD